MSMAYLAQPEQQQQLDWLDGGTLAILLDGKATDGQLMIGRFDVSVQPGHGGHHGHTEQAPGSRVVRQAQIVLQPTDWEGVELALSSTNAIERMA